MKRSSASSHKIHSHLCQLTFRINVFVSARVICSLIHVPKLWILSLAWDNNALSTFFVCAPVRQREKTERDSDDDVMWMVNLWEKSSESHTQPRNYWIIYAREECVIVGGKRKPSWLNQSRFVLCKWQIKFKFHSPLNFIHEDFSDFNVKKFLCSSVTTSRERESEKKSKWKYFVIINDSALLSNRNQQAEAEKKSWTT